MAPLWLTIAMGPVARPGSRNGEAKVATRREGRWAKPWQLGPMMRSPVRSASSRRRACATRPASPTSAKPLLNTMAARTPLAAASSSDSSTRSAGTTTMARSTSSGIAPIEGKAGRPCTVARAGLTGNTRPA
jgi:hypothetical protein